MTDTSPTKTLWGAFKAFLKATLHYILLPVIAGLKGIITALTHLHDGLEDI